MFIKNVNKSGILYFNLSNPTVLNFDKNYNKFLICTTEILKKYKKTKINLINIYDVFHEKILNETDYDISVDQLKELDAFFFDYADQYLRWSFNLKLNISDIRTIYHKNIEYWLFFFKNYKIKKIYFDTAPHRAIDYLAYRIAKLNNIETVIFETTNINYRVFAKPTLRPDIADLKKLNQNKKIDDIEINLEHVPGNKKIKKINFFFDEVILFAKFFFKIIFFIKRENYLLPHSKNIFLNNFKYFIFIYNAKFKILLYKIIYNLNCCDLKKTQITENDIIFYKHYQPEATSNPLSLPMTNQEQCISYLLKTKKNIFVKEHPTALSFNNRHFNKCLNKISDIFFYKKNGIKLINSKYSGNHICVTLSGTSGLENALLGHKVVCFSKPWYYFLPNVHVYRNKKNLELFLNDRKSYDVKEIKKQILNFINDYTAEFKIVDTLLRGSTFLQHFSIKKKKYLLKNTLNYLKNYYN